MLEKLEAILDRFAELDRRLAEAGTDFQLIAELPKNAQTWNRSSTWRVNIKKTWQRPKKPKLGQRRRR